MHSIRTQDTHHETKDQLFQISQKFGRSNSLYTTSFSPVQTALLKEYLSCLSAQCVPETIYELSKINFAIYKLKLTAVVHLKLISLLIVTYTEKRCFEICCWF